MSSVLELANYAAPYSGNFIASLRALETGLQAQNTDTVYVFPERARARDWCRALQDEGCAVYFLPASVSAAVSLLRRILHRHNVRLVHSHFIDRSAYVPLRIACLGRQIPHVFHAHSLPKFSQNDPLLFLRRSLLHPARILCVGDAVRDAYAARGFCDCITLPNGIDFTRLDTAEKLPEKSPSVLMFGYDFSIKGIDTALEAFARNDPAHTYTLRICVANHMDKAQQYLLDRFGEVPSWVELLPPRTDVGTYYKNADIFLSASRTEGMPYAVLEAAFCGLPLVLSDIAPHAQLLLPQAALFPVGDPDALFEVLSAAAEQDRTQNPPYVLHKFSMQEWVSQVLAQFSIL